MQGPPASLRQRLILSGLLSVALLALACRPPAPPPARPLLDDLHQPDLLIEAARLDHRPSLDGHRFLAGWWPWRDGEGRVRLNPLEGGSRLEIVQLAARPRRLVLDLAGGTGGEVAVRFGDRLLAQAPVEATIELPLPADLPLGRVPLDLTFSGSRDVALAGAAVRPVAHPGEIERVGDEIHQQGTSLLEAVRPVAGRHRLTGRFVPPPAPAPDQRFVLRVEDATGRPLVERSWPDNGLRGAFDLTFDAPPAPGWRRIRLLAQGAGPAATWHDLRWEGGTQPTTPRAAAGAETTAPTTERPKLVVLYVLDALRADALGAYGSPRGASPTLDRLAQEGWLFANHRSTAPNTLPSTKALLTGHAPRFRGGWKIPADGLPTLAEQFADAGYRTGLFSGNVYVSPTYGTDRGFEHAALVDGGTTGPVNDNAARIHAAAEAWLDTLPATASVFLYLHTIHPHNPYTPPEPLRSRFAPRGPSAIDGATETLLDVQRGRRTLADGDRERLRGLYAGALAYNDQQIGHLLDALAERFAPQDTVLAVTSDHGEELFDHGGLLHGYTLYREMIEIPLILWAPGRLAPRRIAAATDTTDLHATLRGLVVSGEPAGRNLLASQWSPQPVRFAAAASVPGGIFSARSDRLELIFAPRQGLGWGQGDGLGRSKQPVYLFDLEGDPEQRLNLAGDGRPEAAWLRERLRAWIESGRPAEDGATPPAEDEETRRQLEALGYL
ncbi:MAG: sulfatase [Acidobacteriota bacterium]